MAHAGARSKHFRMQEQQKKGGLSIPNQPAERKGTKAQPSTKRKVPKY